MKWFKIYGEPWFMGSTRWELTVEQRSVWIDLLARASINDPPGQINFFSLEQLTQQFNVDLELLESTIKRCVEVKKIKFYPEKQKIVILKWKKYQSEYQRQLPYRKRDKTQSEDTEKGDNSCNKVTLRKEGEEKRKDREENENKEEENLLTTDNSQCDSPLPSNTNSFSEKGLTKKDEFLSMLRKSKGYPFDEFKDSLLFDITVKECPKINILKQTAKKIAWWKEHPEALKAYPRNQLEEWFKEEQKLQERGGPQMLGQIMEGIDDTDHRNFLKQLIRPQRKKDEKKER